MISVIIPVYNVEKFLQSCIDSLLAQTYKDIEFIFVNDASPDNSIEILRRNQQENPDRIRVIDSKENLNIGGARNLGIKAARGEYIGFVDSDDMVAPAMFEKLYAALMASHADVAFIQHTAIHEKDDYKDAVQILDHAKARIDWNSRLLEMGEKELDNQDRLDLHVYQIGGVWSGLWKKTVLLEHDLYFPEHLRYEDNYWSGLVFCYINRVVFIPSIEYFYRINSESTTHKRNQSFSLDRITIEQSLLAEVKRRGLFLDYHSAWEYLYINRYMLNTFFVLSRRWDKVPYEKLVEISKDVQNEFPCWAKNPYFIKLNSKASRFLIHMVIRAPRLTSFFYHHLPRRR